MEQFFEEELVAKTPQNGHLTASTPRIQGGCAKATFPSNITPVAVKQLFNHSNGRHLTESLLDIPTKDMTSNCKGNQCKAKSSMNERSVSLFSSWVDDGETVSTDAVEQSGVAELESSCAAIESDKRLDSPACYQSLDPLSDLLRTPPSLKFRRFVAPKKRASSDSTGDILADLMSAPSKKPKTVSDPQPMKTLSDEPVSSNLSLHQPSADSVANTDSAFYTPSKPAAVVTSTSTPDISACRAHTPAFTHTPRVDNNQTAPVPQYKAVRPAGASKSGFFYPSKRSTNKSEHEAEPADSTELRRPIKPRRLTKFTAPSKTVVYAEEGEHGNQSEALQQTTFDSGFTSPTLRLHTPLPTDLSTESNDYEKLPSSATVELTPTNADGGNKVALSYLNSPELDEFPSVENSLLWDDIQLSEESLPSEKILSTKTSLFLEKTSVSEKSPPSTQSQPTRQGEEAEESLIVESEQSSFEDVSAQTNLAAERSLIMEKDQFSKSVPIRDRLHHRSEAKTCNKVDNKQKLLDYMQKASPIDSPVADFLNKFRKPSNTATFNNSNILLKLISQSPSLLTDASIITKPTKTAAKSLAKSKVPCSSVPDIKPANSSSSKSNFSLCSSFSIQVPSTHNTDKLRTLFHGSKIVGNDGDLLVSSVTSKSGTKSALEDLVQLIDPSANTDRGTRNNCLNESKMPVPSDSNCASQISAYGHLAADSIRSVNSKSPNPCEDYIENFAVATGDQNFALSNSFTTSDISSIVPTEDTATADNIVQQSVDQVALKDVSYEKTERSLGLSSPSAAKASHIFSEEQSNTALFLSSSTDSITEQGNGNKISTTSIDSELPGRSGRCGLNPGTNCDLYASNGFCTAAGKSITVLDSSIQAVSSLFDLFESAENDGCPVNQNKLDSKDFLGKKEIGKNGDKQKLHKTYARFDALKNDSSDKNEAETAQDVYQTVKSNVDNKQPQVGFMTANGRNISISSKSMNAVKSLFEDNQSQGNVEVDLSESMIPSIANPDSNANNIEKFDMSESKLLAEVTRPSECKEEMATHDLGKPSSSFLGKTVHSAGFSTAGGKPIAVSHSSLSAARSIFNDSGNVDEFGYGENSTSHSADITIAKDDSKKTFRSSLQPDTTLLEENEVSAECNKNVSVTQSSPTNTKGSIIGFSTAGGNKISISNASLSAARSLFHLECSPKSPTLEGPAYDSSILKDTPNAPKADSPQANLPNGNSKPHVSGFSTAHGKDIQVSKRSLNAVKNIFEESIALDPENVISKDSVLFIGYSTSSCKPATHPMGFSSASGAQIKISKSSLKAVKNLFDADEFQSPRPKKSSTTGFATALGNAVSVSTSSLSAAKALMKENDSTDADLLPDELSFGDIREHDTEVSKVDTPSAAPDHSLATTTKESDSAVFPSGSGVCQSNSRVPSSLNVPVVGLMSEDEQHSVINCRKVPEIYSPSPSPALSDTLSTCVTPPVKRRMSAFTSHSPLSITPIGLARNRSFTCKAYWTTPTNGGKKFSYGNKPFKPHTPDREALASKLFKVQTPASPPPAATSNKQAVSCARHELAARRENLNVYTADTKPAPLRKPTDCMMSVKSGKKRITLKELGTPSVVDPSQVREEVRELTSTSAATHTFSHVTSDMRQAIQELCAECDVTGYLSPVVSADNLYRCFQMMEGVDPALITKDWFTNHYRWIVWKSARLERSYPDRYGGVCNPLYVLKQMKYRYEREVDLSQRSAVRKIFEGDDLASRTMVLLVSSTKLNSSDDSSSQGQMELTDGWYAIKTSHDPELTDLIEKGLIREGTKLVVSGAQRSGADQDCSPLSSMASDIYLRISTNSVRRAKYYAKLGYTAQKLQLSLNSLLPLGGAVPCLKLLISTVYPLVYMEKTESGTVFRNETKERQVRREDSIKRDKLMEQAMNKENEICADVVKKGKRRHYTEQDIRQTNSGEELLSMVLTAIDPDVVQQMMTERQREEMFVHQQKMVSERTASIQSSVKALLPPERAVTPLLKVRVSSMHLSDQEEKSWTILTIWRPTHDMISLLKEGCVFNAYNLSANQLRGRKVNAPVLLSANKRSMFERVTVSKALLDTVYTPRQVLTPADIRRALDEPGAVEFTTAGVIVGWETPHDNLTVVFIASGEGEMLALNFWGGLKAHGYTEMVKEGTLIHCSNLQRGSTPLRYTLPSLTVTELTAISVSPTHSTSSSYVRELSALNQGQRIGLVRECQRRLLELAQTSGSHRRQQPMKNSRRPYSTLPVIGRSSDQSQHPLPSIPKAVISAGSRQALVKQFHSPVIKERSSSMPQSTHNTSVEGESDEEVSDSELLACISQS